MKRQFGRYRVLRNLATGGMGEILLAEQTGLSGFCKRVVLKRIRGDLAADPSYLRLFLNEARTGSFINHPHIAHIFDVGQDGGDLFLVMEYVDGIDLKRLRRRAALAQRALGPETSASIAVDVLCALAWAHGGGPLAGSPIIHRDVSPENIMIGREGSVKILDFGLAKWWPKSPTVESLEGRVIFGKVRYMPPEQLRGLPIDARADLFSLGVTLYEALTGDLPFGRGTANEVLARIRAGAPPPPTPQRFAPDPALDAIVLRALEPNPDDRFDSAEAMRAALVDYLRARGAVLPREPLRALLSSLRSVDDPIARAAEAHPTELSMPIAERCGKCGGVLHAFVVDDVILDQCEACHGTWVDRAEIERLLGHGMTSEIGSAPADAAGSPSLDRLLGSCPIDRVGLASLSVPGRDFSIEACPVCHGLWFDRDELGALAEGEVANWLEETLHRLPEATRPSGPHIM